MITVAGGILLALVVLALLPFVFMLLGALLGGIGEGIGLIGLLVVAGIPFGLLAVGASYLAQHVDAVVPGVGTILGFALIIGVPAAAMVWDYRRLK